MVINTEAAIAWMTSRQGKVSYSMDFRDGPNSYDCSSSVYYALRSAGASSAGWAVNTESAHNWLIANGYALIAENRDWNMQRGDVIIWGRKGHSIGSGGHAMLAIDSTRIIHCSYGYNGINVNNYDQYYGWNAGTMGGPYVYVYRQKTTPNSAAATKQTASTQTAAGSLEKLASEVMAGKYGSGAERQKALGKKYTAVQTIINERLKAITAQQAHQRLADEVMKGNLGVGEERKKNLGTYYQTVQNIINR